MSILPINPWLFVCFVNQLFSSFWSLDFRILIFWKFGWFSSISLSIHTPWIWNVIKMNNIAQLSVWQILRGNEIRVKLEGGIMLLSYHQHLFHWSILLMNKIMKSWLLMKIKCCSDIYSHVPDSQISLQLITSINIIKWFETQQQPFRQSDTAAKQVSKQLNL